MMSLCSVISQASAEHDLGSYISCPQMQNKFPISVQLDIFLNMTAIFIVV